MEAYERDSLRRFLFEQHAIRGALVHLDGSWQTALSRRAYPAPVRNVLGELMAASALLCANLKSDSILTLQLQGDGPISLLVMEATSEHALRGLAKWREGIQAAPVKALLGEGRLLMTLDSGLTRERYQGIVEITGDSLAESLEHYLLSSEQLETRLWLAADEHQATGLLLQRLPGRPESDLDAWPRISHLAGTLQREELLGLPAQEIIYRLFHEEDVRMFETEPVFFRCSCSRERVANMLRTLGERETRDILAEQGRISVDCEFCNHHYEFDAVDAQQLFAAPAPTAPPTQH